MAIKDYIPISNSLSEFLGQLLGKYQPKREYALAGNSYVFFAEEACGSTCSGTCTNTCTGGCSTTCTGSCSGVRCQTTCAGGCSGECSGSCTGNCSGSCSDGCYGSCKGTCANTCENYCQICQTFCEYEQVFSKNNGSNKGTGMGNSFSWNRTYAPGDKIIIEAIKWNELAEYINNAQTYCSTTSIDVTDDVETGDLITAAIWNNLNDGLANLKNGGRVSTATQNITTIKATEVNSLASKYNAAQIRTGLPSNSDGAKNLCCQNGMTPETDWGSKQPCANGETPTTSGTNYTCAKRQ